MKIEALKLHLPYTVWASGKLLEAAATLNPEELERDFQTADKSVLGTLVHVFAADRVWLSRVRGLAGQFITPEDRSLAVLQRDWPAVHQGWMELLDGETEETIARPIAYKDLAGNSHMTPLWQIMLHMVNHGTHHRGQVSGFLRAMGHPPPQLDLIRYYRSLA
jgi:uncharacterized damage-inducible protein DinB